MTSADVRGELNEHLLAYLEQREPIDAVHEWVSRQDLDGVEEPLHRDLSILLETMEDVRSGQREEQDLRELAEGLTAGLRR